MTDLAQIEDVAVGLVRHASAEITHALGRVLAVRYKTDKPDENILRDPVSDADVKVEQMIRAEVARQFPDHAVIGEEMGGDAVTERDFAWVVDPIDGTSNFVNGFPMFAASIGVLHRGKPVVGALWCSTSHALRAGVYHAHWGGPLYFDEDKIERRSNVRVRRLLVGEPFPEEGAPWEGRHTGSAAVECAFVAAGVLRAAWFERPNIWDVGGGVALLRAAGLDVHARGANGWAAFDGFGEGLKALSSWHQELAVGEAHAVNLICARR
jgi:myo-inositol-1(or 4)-monophosphatase